MPLVTISVVTQTDDVVPVPIDGVTVQLYDDNDVFLAAGVTGVLPDPPGTVTFMATGTATPGTAHIIRVRKTGVEFAQPTQLIYVIDPLGPTETNVFDVVGHIATIPESDDDDLCRLSAHLTDIAVRPLPGIVVKFIPVTEFPNFPPISLKYSTHFPSNPAMVRNFGLYAPVEVLTDDEGYLEIDLPRNGVFDIHVHGFEHPIPIVERITVPDEPGWLLLDILLRYVASVTFTPSSLSMSVGDVEDLAVSITGSDNIVLTDIPVINSLLDFKSSDTSVISITLVDESTLTVTAVGAGSATITVTRRDKTVATRRPAVPALVVTNTTITVS